MHYSILHRTGHYQLICNGNKDRSCSLNDLVHYMCNYPSFYNVQNCSGSETCISIMVPPGQSIACKLPLNNHIYTISLKIQNSGSKINMYYEAMAFLTPHRDSSEAYDLFVLCSINGIDLNSYIREGSTPLALRLSESLLQKANKMIQSTLDKAMNSLWRDRIWSKYMVPQSSTEDASRDIIALRSLSNVVPVSEVDDRFASILFGHDANINYNLNELETSMKSEAMFSNWTEVSMTDECTCHVIYFESENGYLLVQREIHGPIQECEVVMKNQNDDPIPIISSFGSFFLLWVYNNAEIL